MKKAMLLLAMLLANCSVEPCDSNQVTDAFSFCVAAPVAGAGGSLGGAMSADSGGAEDAGGAGQPGDAGVCDAPSAFSDVCTNNDDCRCDVNYCAVQPGSAVGMCTRTGCVEDPSVCPESWSCFDLKIFDPKLPSICVPPA